MESHSTSPPSDRHNDSIRRRTTQRQNAAKVMVPASPANMTTQMNRLLTWGSLVFSYDLNGNLASDGLTSYSWNARNQLVGLNGGTSASFAYDGMGRRRSKTVSGATTKFLYDELNFVQEQSGGGTPTANLLTGADVDETFTRADASGTSTLLIDALGSVLALADASGTVQTQYTYEPFGATTLAGATSTNTQQFTGRESDAAGLYFYRARYYTPSFARFGGEDPIGLLGGPNLFAFVANNPIGFRDPLGLQVRTPAQGQPPNSTQWHPNADGSWTRTYFGDDGRALVDQDFGQRHGNDPEIHRWDWTKRPPRGPGQPWPKELPPSEFPPAEPPAPVFPLPWPLPSLVPPWMVPMVNPCLMEPTICRPRPSKTMAFNAPTNDLESGVVTDKPQPVCVPGKWRDFQRANG